MKKRDVLDAILTALDEEFDALRSASASTRQEGNDAESRSEGKYDTRSTEANYLADAQARHADVAARALAAFRELELREFSADAAIDLGALLQVRIGRESPWFFLGPASGGLEVEVGGTEVTVITPEAPLGRQLVGRKAGDETAQPKARILRVL